MDQETFKPYAGVLRRQSFEIVPAPFPVVQETDRFKYVNHDATQLRIADANTGMELVVSLSLVEFANPGILKLRRLTKVHRDSLV